MQIIFIIIWFNIVWRSTKHSKYKSYILILFFSIYIIFGLFIYRDFGIGIEEHFQRLNGFHWLNYFLSFSDFDLFKEAVNLKYNDILKKNPNLPNIVFFNSGSNKSFPFTNGVQEEFATNTSFLLWLSIKKIKKKTYRNSQQR